MNSKDLYKVNDSSVWKTYLEKYEGVIELVSKNKKKDELIQLDKWLWNNLKKDVYDRYKKEPLNGYYLTKNELSNIMKWKLIRGKFRPLQKLVDSNSEDTVTLCTGKALNILCDVNDKEYNNWKNALKELMKLKGIGVATASIILAIFVPTFCPFMSDEVIESVYDGKIDYTLSVYLNIQSKLVDKVQLINVSCDMVWNTEMLGKALWVAHILQC